MMHSTKSALAVLVLGASLGVAHAQSTAEPKAVDQPAAKPVTRQIVVVGKDSKEKDSKEKAQAKVKTKEKTEAPVATKATEKAAPVAEVEKTAPKAAPKAKAETPEVVEQPKEKIVEKEPVKAKVAKHPKRHRYHDYSYRYEDDEPYYRDRPYGGYGYRDYYRDYYNDD